MAAKKTGGSSKAAEAPASGDLMRESVQGLFDAVKKRASHSLVGGIESTTKNLVQRAEDLSVLPSGSKDLADGKPVKAVASMGASKAKDKIKQAFQGLTGGGGGKGGRGKLKVTNIVEAVDVGVPIDVAYDQWTRFTEFPTFMKKVEHVEQEAEEKLTWKAQIFWSHRSWESEITEQVPDERIVWTSKGQKGHVDGAVTFHELAPSLTRIVIVLSYHPQGLFEHVGNMWRAQGRRARLELKHFQRHVMTDTILHADELEGWRGEIHDGEVTPPEEVEKREEQEQSDTGDEAEDDERDSDDSEDREPEAEDDSGDESEDDESEEDESEEDESDEGESKAQDETEGRRDRKPRRRSRGAEAQDEAEDDDRDSDDEKPQGKGGGRRATPRRRSDADDRRDQDRPAGKRQQRPARKRSSRAAEKAGSS